MAGDPQPTSDSPRDPAKGNGVGGDLTQGGVSISADGGQIGVGGDIVGRDKKVEAGTYIEHATFVTAVPVPPPPREGPAPGECPFKGLQYFDQADTHLFFGRDPLTAKLVERLRQDHFLAVVGASGSGKSSVVRAGLVPTLKRVKPLKDETLLPAGSDR
jgi:ABC-type multidrug transport system fused ATPase/permease subunit